MPRPVQVYDFTAFSVRTPTQQQPGDRLDAQFRAHADAIGGLQQHLNALAESVLALAAGPREATLGTPSLYVNAGGPYAGDDAGATATSADYAQVAIAWAEHMPDTIPPNILAVNAISGDHWSARWWANRAASVAPGVVSSLYYVSAAGQTVFPLTILDHFGKSFTFTQANPESVHAYVNGDRLTPTDDFTVNVPASTVTLTHPAVLGAIACFDLLAPAEAPTIVAIGDNRIINGDMRIDQRNGGASGTATGFTVDRWGYGASQPSKGSWRRVLNVPQPSAGFPYSLSFISSSAYTPAATEQFIFSQSIEADQISDFQFGTVNAQPVTLSFWVYSSLTGTFSGALQNYAQNRSYPFSYSVPTVNTWTKIFITIPGDTAGTWVMNGNAGAAYLIFDLGSGTTPRGPANAWASATYVGVTGAVRVVSTNAAGFFLTGVKLETGAIATPFNRQSLAKSMADCQRYYQTFPYLVLGGYLTGSGPVYESYPLPVLMRTSPTVVFSGQAYTNASAIAVNSANASALSASMTITVAGSALGTTAVALNAEL